MTDQSKDDAGKTRSDGPGSADAPLSRRNLFGGIALGLLLPRTMSAAEVTQHLLRLDLVTMHNLLRGLVLLEDFDDPLIDADADGLREQIETHVPHARLLTALYREYADRGFHPPWRDEQDGDLRTLHRAVAYMKPVSFRYRDLNGDVTSRRVLPLALVHPPHGIQLLAWCELRGGYRKFFVASMQRITAHADGFDARCDALMQGLLEHEGLGTGPDIG